VSQWISDYRLVSHLVTRVTVFNCLQTCLSPGVRFHLSQVTVNLAETGTLVSLYWRERRSVTRTLVSPSGSEFRCQWARHWFHPDEVTQHLSVTSSLVHPLEVTLDLSVTGTLVSPRWSYSTAFIHRDTASPAEVSVDPSVTGIQVSPCWI
jgi:hypothetical protein